MSQFANITHYNDLKNLIADRPEFVFKFEEETNTYVIKYNLLLAGSFDHEDEEARKLLVEARGITFDADTGAVVSRKYHKFYNIGEKTCSQIQNIDFSKTHWVMEKLDGCLSYDTILVTENGPMSIKDICDNRYSGKVLGFDHETNLEVWTNVVDYSEKENNNDWYELELDDGTILHVTGNHKIWIDSLKEYVPVNQINLIDNESILLTE